MTEDEIIMMMKYLFFFVGEKFDLKGFHKTVLRNGPMSFTNLQKVVDRWISAVKSSSSGACLIYATPIVSLVTMVIMLMNVWWSNTYFPKLESSSIKLYILLLLFPSQRDEFLVSLNGKYPFHRRFISSLRQPYMHPLFVCSWSLPHHYTILI